MNLRIEAAKFFICNDDIEKAVELLDNANNTIPDEVTVTEKFEYEPLENIIELINDLEDVLNKIQKTKETRVFVVNMDEFDSETEIAQPEVDGFNEELFMLKAEEEGRVYTLKGFQAAFNDEEISDACDYILFKEIEIQE